MATPCGQQREHRRPVVLAQVRDRVGRILRGQVLQERGNHRPLAGGDELFELFGRQDVKTRLGHGKSVPAAC